jgi:N12 class adenine-specific DNA methylase
MICAGMEQRRLGLIEEPLYTVPNHMLAQFAREFMELYPAANIMIADEHNFHTANRRRFVAQAALNAPDAVVITHSAFGRIGMSDEFYEDFVGAQVIEWEDLLSDLDSGERLTRKQIARRIEALERRLDARLAAGNKDAVLTFEKLGVDFIFCDEAQDFRKLDFTTNQGTSRVSTPMALSAPSIYS